MNLSRSQKRLVAVIGMSGLALVVDKLVLGPADAQAAPNESATLTVTPDPTTLAPEVLPTEEVSSGSALAAQFDALAAEHAITVDTIGNAFLAPADWLPQGMSTGVVDSSALAFASAHELKGVMALGNVGYAMIDDRRLKVGDLLDGYRLAAIGDRSATFVNEHGEEVVLQLQR